EPITQGFGCTDYWAEPPGDGCAHFHSGIDIAGNYGQDIFAADSGVVNTYSSSYGYGNYIVITHGNGYSTLYGHMSGFNVGSGAVVHRGDVIGFEGSTGNSSGPHLHFEVRVNGTPVNPCGYLDPGC